MRTYFLKFAPSKNNTDMTVYLSRDVHFCAAHKLYNEKWSKEKNEEIFGLCANENWHGHNFHMTVTVKGRPDEDTGFVMNFKDLNRIIKQEVLVKVDHKNLNMDVPFMTGKMTSCETLVCEFWKILAPVVQNATDGRVSLHCIKIKETASNYAEYYGE
jgi:6-pyruvoyltetrahydropterin/6-carboxytetrahydropterin synthase